MLFLWTDEGNLMRKRAHVCGFNWINTNKSQRGITLYPGFMFFELQIDGIVQEAGSFGF